MHVLVIAAAGNLGASLIKRPSAAPHRLHLLLHGRAFPYCLIA
jgi:hypothetical protein